jgi:hypothetical protein
MLAKNAGFVKDLQDKGLKCAKMQDSPAKSGTVGKYGIVPP